LVLLSLLAISFSSCAQRPEGMPQWMSPFSIHVMMDRPDAFYATVLGRSGLSADDYEALRQYAEKTYLRSREGGIFVYDDAKAEELDRSAMLGGLVTAEEKAYAHSHCFGTLNSSTGGGHVASHFTINGRTITKW
jgi:hypothetical protein